ncbi:MAG: hypothetical protein DRI57_12375 [Deltaproteobacteria bacterium]|nr:MAG: hypothetical protein DRI57_12375 [Deltaproteobacteria bacterium]
MKDFMHGTLLLKLGKENFSSFSPIFQQGFQIKTLAGRSIKNLLCEQYKIEADYLAERIKTIFLDGKPVDDVETALVKDGSAMALSAAMPGLVGSTFRRGSYLSAFRSGITYQEEDAAGDTHKEGMVRIKLFNLLTGELGPVFLRKGIWVKKENIADLLKDGADMLRSLIHYAEKDGQEMPPEQTAVINWSEEPENMHLRVVV